MARDQRWIACRLAVAAAAALLAGCGPRGVVGPQGGSPGDSDAASTPEEPVDAAPLEPGAETAGSAPEEDAAAPPVEDPDAAPAELPCAAFEAADCPERCRLELGAMVVRPEFTGECADDSAFKVPGDATPYYEAGHYQRVVEGIQRCLRTWFHPRLEGGEPVAALDAAFDFRYRIAEGAGGATRLTVAAGEVPDAESLLSCFESGIQANYAGGALVEDQQFPPPRTLRCSMHLQVEPGETVCR